MRSHIQFGSKRIDYSLEYCERKTLGISVLPDQSVSIRAPLGASPEKIMEKLKKRAPWILEQQSFFLSFYPKTPPRRFVSGETHLYFGRQYRLKIEQSDNESVKLRGPFIVVACSDHSSTKQLVNDWYYTNARTKILSLAKRLAEKFAKYKVEPSEIILREMPTRWGSCTAEGKIILNPELIKAPRGCIEYVIVHELCHLIHHDHTPKFVELQTKEIPSWEKWKAKLERLLA